MRTPFYSFPVVVITKAELEAFKKARDGIRQLKSLSAERGLIFNRVNPDKSLTGPNFKTWFDENGNLCQQNYF